MEKKHFLGGGTILTWFFLNPDYSQMTQKMKISQELRRICKNRKRKKSDSGDLQYNLIHLKFLSSKSKKTIHDNLELDFQ